MSYNADVEEEVDRGVAAAVVVAKSRINSGCHSRSPVVGLVTPHHHHLQDHEDDYQNHNHHHHLHHDDDDDDVALLPEPVAATAGHQDDIFASCQLASSYGDDVGISWQKAVFLIVNAGLGAGLLNFPKAFHESGGIVSGNLVHIIFTSFALGSLIILVKCANERRCSTYQELVLHMCNPGWNVVASLCISVYCFITCITFIIIIGDQFDRVFASFVGKGFCHTWYFNRKFTMTVSSLLLIFPCCFKRIDGLRFMSYVGVLSILYLVAVIVGEFYTGSYNKGPVIFFDVHWTQIFDVVPTICFGYQCHVSSIPIYSCLKEHNASSSFIKACVAAIVVCFLVYTVSANYGYLTFGSLVKGDVLLSYDARKMQVLIAVILLAIKSWTTYPILMFCVREAVGDLYIQLRSLSPVEAARTESLRRKLIALTLWGTSMLIAVFTPNINIVVKLLGSLAAIFIFVFPGLPDSSLVSDLWPSLSARRQVFL
ncbi:sodium-coupled neutral amino acid transporter 7 isoform X2 [Cherax quadricarinatus]|uniref:sodium-coupled neutral amino acid transporter 7 isoform X2 n=1 Tax=Cherax quadricarinatus TaxID=27406 RepID=UPI00387ECD8C